MGEEQAPDWPDRFEAAWAAVRERFRPKGPEDVGLFPACVRATRGWTVAYALIAIVLGFTADDLELLRVPGYLVGLVTAVVILSVGGLVAGQRLRARIVSLDPTDPEAVIQGYRTRGQLAAIVAVAGTLLWLVYFSQGVAPWAL